MVTLYPVEELSADYPNGQPPVNANRININAAPPQVLRALPQMTDDLVLSVLEYRAEQPIKSIAQIAPVVGSVAYGAISRYLTTDLVSYYTIYSMGMIPVC